MNTNRKYNLLMIVVMAVAISIAIGTIMETQTVLAKGCTLGSNGFIHSHGKCFHAIVPPIIDGGILP